MAKIIDLSIQTDPLPYFGVHLRMAVAGAVREQREKSDRLLENRDPVPTTGAAGNIGRLRQAAEVQ
jgi:hypothetical protein